MEEKRREEKERNEHSFEQQLHIDVPLLRLVGYRQFHTNLTTY